MTRARMATNAITIGQRDRQRMDMTAIIGPATTAARLRGRGS